MTDPADKESMIVDVIRSFLRKSFSHFVHTSFCGNHETPTPESLSFWEVIEVNKLNFLEDPARRLGRHIHKIDL
jgi:hypothetical protein